MTENKANDTSSVEETTALETGTQEGGLDETARNEAPDALGGGAERREEPHDEAEPEGGEPAGDGGGRKKKRLAAIIGGCACVALVVGLAYALCTQPIGAGAESGSGSGSSSAVMGSAGSGEAKREATVSLSVEAPEWTDEAGAFKILVKAKDGGAEQEVEAAPGKPAEVELAPGGYTAALEGIPTLPDGKTYKVPEKQEFTVDEGGETNIEFSLELMDPDDEAAVEAAIEALPEDEREEAREKYAQKKADPNRPSAGGGSSSSGGPSGSSSGGSSGGTGGGGSSSGGGNSGGQVSQPEPEPEPEPPAHTHSYTIPYYKDVYQGRQEVYTCNGCGRQFYTFSDAEAHGAEMAKAGTPHGGYTDDSYDIWGKEIAGYECSCGARPS